MDFSQRETKLQERVVDQNIISNGNKSEQIFGFFDKIVWGYYLSRRSLTAPLGNANHFSRLNGDIGKKVETTDYYSILQIDAQATQEEVRAAYRRLALLYHPDQSNLPLATQQMQELNEAYFVLSNQEKRAQYDELRLAPPAPTPEAQVPADPAHPHPPPTAQAAKAQAATHPPSRSRARHWIDQKDFLEQVRKRRVWMKNRLKLITWLILMVLVSFIWSLATGQVSIIAIIGFVLLALYLIASMFIKIKKLAR